MSAPPSDDLAARCAAACEIAYEAGAVARRYFRKFEELEAQEKGPQDVVTAADLAVDRLIRLRLSQAFPQDSLLSEESAGSGPDNERLWVADPIDGTGNFVRGLAHFAVSIAFCQKGITDIGVIYDVMADELFVARRDCGATCNGITIKANKIARAGAGLIEAGYSSRHPMSDYLKCVGDLSAAGYEFCQHGSAALGLAHVACGRLDGYWELSLFSWDVLAGLLLVEEAGGWSSGFDPRSDTRSAKPVLACAKPLASSLQRITGVM